MVFRNVYSNPIRPHFYDAVVCNASDPPMHAVALPFLGRASDNPQIARRRLIEPQALNNLLTRSVVHINTLTLRMVP